MDQLKEVETLQPPLLFLGLSGINQQSQSILYTSAEIIDCKQVPRSPRRNELPVKRINGSLLMGHEHLSRALVELMQIRQTPSGTDRVLHHAPEAFDRVEMMPTMGR